MSVNIATGAQPLEPVRTTTFMRSWPLLALLALLPGGCQNNQVVEYERRIAELQQTVREHAQRLEAQHATIQQLNRQLDSARGVPADWREHLIYPERLQVDSLTGGADYDGKPGDDGVTVYLTPVDADGDAIKAAGEIRVELYDLAAPENQQQLGVYTVPVEEARKLWYGALMTSHFTVKCPWKSGPPTQPEVTVRATFIDYLMKRVMTAQTTCTVNLP